MGGCQPCLVYSINLDSGEGRGEEGVPFEPRSCVSGLDGNAILVKDWLGAIASAV